MPTVGEKLRNEREAHGKSLDEMADATGIGRSYLEALERDDVRELPGRAFGKLYIRAYAEVLGFDAKPWIDAYDRERRADPDEAVAPRAEKPAQPRAVEAQLARWRESKEKPAREAAVAETPPATVPRRSPHPEAPPSVPTREKRIPLGAIALFIVIVSIVAVAWFFARGISQAPPLANFDGPPPATAAASAPPPSAVTPAPTKPAELVPPPTKPSVTTASEAALTITEFGVGRHVVSSHLEGESNRFDVGDRVCFMTRVLGGERGGRIRHVWVRDGAVEQSIPLRLGGHNWLTYSNKSLGRAGSWAVEARDDSGRVLARANFTCGSAGH